MPRHLDILIVDDTAYVDNCLQEVLSAAGFSVRVTYGAEEALRSIATNLPDVVISEIETPGMSGLELAAHVRSAYVHSRPFMVAHSAVAEASFGEKARRAGFDEFLPKPVAAVELFILLEEIRQRRAGRLSS